MEAINANKLKGKIVECGYTVASLAKELGVHPSTLTRQINSPDGKMSVGEANRIVQILGLTADDAAAIFFNSSVA